MNDDDNPFATQRPAGPYAPMPIPDQRGQAEVDDNPFSTRPPAPPVVPQAAAGVPSATATAEQPGYAEDIGKGVVGGLGRGVTGLMGLPGTIGDLTRAGLRKVGVPEGAIDVGAEFARRNPFTNVFTVAPSGAQVQHKAEEYTGPFYEPKTIPGQFASTIAEFAPSTILGPGAPLAKVVNTVAGGAGSEFAGQLTKDTAAEPWARALGGVAGGVTGAKALTPAPRASAQRVADLATIRAADPEFKFTAGQLTGSRPLEWLTQTARELPFTGGQAQAQEQATRINRMMTGSMFDPAALRARGVPEELSTLPNARVMREGRQSLSDKYDQILQSNDLVGDPRMGHRITQAVREYGNQPFSSLNTREYGTLIKIGNEIADRFAFHGGSISGQEYKALRSRLNDFKSAAYSGERPDNKLGDAYRGIRNALDEAYRRNINPQAAAELAQNDLRWANMRQLERAIAAGQATGNMSPAQIASALQSGRRSQFVQGAGNLDELAQALNRVVKPLPMTGTGERGFYQGLLRTPEKVFAGSTAAGTGVGTLTAGPLGGLVGAAIGAAVPSIVGRILLTRPAQRILGNQIAPQNARDILATTLLQQAATQSSGIERNAAGQEALQGRIDEQRRQMGLPPIPRPLRINLQQGSPPL